MAAITGQYKATQPTYSDGDFVEVLPTDSKGNLMVNIAAGEEINVGTLTLGTINMMKAGTIDKVAAGTIDMLKAGTIDKLAAGTVDMLKAGTISAGTINSGTINAGTINSGTINAGTIDKIGGGTIDMIKAGTIDKLAGGTVDMLKGGTIDAGTVSMPIVYSLATVTVGSGKIAGTSTCAQNGMVYKITQACGTFTGTPGSITTKLIDALGGTIASLTVQAESSTATYSTVVPLHTNMSWIVTATDADGGTQNADNAATIALYYSK